MARITDDEDRNENFSQSRRKFIITTCVIYFGNISYSCAINSFSPTLTDFKNKYGVETSEISTVFTAAVTCYMVGALTCSFLYNFINRQLCVIILFLGITTSMMLAPHAPTIAGFYLLFGLCGFCVGCYETAQIVWIMEMWQSKSPPFIQAQHFFYAFGTVLSPVIISPFLKQKFDSEEEENTPSDGKNSRLFVPFTIIGCLCAVSAVGQVFLFIFMRYRPPPPENEENIIEPAKEIKELTESSHQTSYQGKIRKFFTNIHWPTVRLVVLSALTLGFYQGMEMGTMSLFPTFGQRSSLHLSESKAADTLSALTIAYAVGRGAGIILIFKVPPMFLLMSNLLLIITGNIILLIWGQSSINFLWASAILFGLGFSTIYPSFFAFMERYLIFTNPIGSFMVVAGSCVGALYPLISGSFIDDHPLVITYPVFFSLAVLVCTVTLSYKVTRGMTKHING